MSGPTYPHQSREAGSGAIGSFIIGVSHIGTGGTVRPFDVWSTIISQYANSERLTQVINDFADCVDQTLDFDLLFDIIWNVETAVGYGLDVWGRIVGVSRTLTISTLKYFGFEQQAPAVDVFGPGGVSPFYSGVNATTNFDLTDEAFRTLILAKALANICDGSITAINRILLLLFPGRGACYVTDGGNMTMTYTFNFELSPVEVAIVSSSGALPKPVGVSATVVQNF